MDNGHSEQVLAEIDKHCRENNVSKRDLAEKLGIAYNTFRIWFHKGVGKSRPSKANIDKLEKFLQSARETDTHWNQLWLKIIEWWETQHQYSSLVELARDIGWDARNLAAYFVGKEIPPRLVIEKIASIIGLDTSDFSSVIQNAMRKTKKLKHLLLFLEEELRWFRDNQEEAREVLRKQLDASDTGYIASLLTMLADEDKFQRWLKLTSNRFGFFRKRGDKQ
jgi:transcriptional regulator with XRE-family HTH domain